MRVGIIDLGSNAFNLLIASIGQGGQWSTEFSCTIPVFLGRGRSGDLSIAEARVVRAKDALHTLYTSALNYDCNLYRAFGTEFMRTSPNAKDIYDPFVSQSIIPRPVILSGSAEACLIAKGAICVLPNDGEAALIIDIGGGSMELAVVKEDRIYEAISLPIGVSRISELISLSNPLTSDNLKSIKRLIKKEISDYLSRIRHFGITKLLGTSGSFDTFSAMTSGSKVSGAIRILKVKEFEHLHRRLVSLSTEGRAGLTSMEPARSENIHLASIIVSELITHSSIGQLYTTPYALKEGLALALADGTLDTILAENPQLT